METKFTLSAALVQAAAAEHFRSGDDLVSFFKAATGRGFVDWFNATCASKANWAGKSLHASAAVSDRFVRIWNCIPLMFDKDSVNLIEFASLMSILINEAGPDLLPATELCGHQTHPGLTYAFEEIPGLKRSYNLAQGNLAAGTLFFDNEAYWRAHGELPGGDLVHAIPDMRYLWSGSVYPQALFPTSLDPAHSGFIQQADFFKFRGRGFIQTTLRANYKPIVTFVQSYRGANATVLRFKAAWAGQDADVVCTVSTNADWDALFQDPEFIIPCRAISIHNHANGNFLNLSTEPAALAKETPGSLFYMGLRISGGRAYASLFAKRVTQLLTTLNYLGRASR